MRLACVLTLLIVLPFTGVRMVCLEAESSDADSLGSRVAATSAAGAPATDGTPCEHQCAKHAHKAPKPACRLVAGDDDQCSYVLDGVAAVLQHSSASNLIAPRAVPFEFVPPTGDHPAPVLPPPGPPPKS